MKYLLAFFISSTWFPSFGLVISFIKQERKFQHYTNMINNLLVTICKITNILIPRGYTANYTSE